MNAPDGSLPKTATSASHTSVRSEIHGITAIAQRPHGSTPGDTNNKCVQTNGKLL